MIIKQGLSAQTNFFMVTISIPFSWMAYKCSTTVLEGKLHPKDLNHHHPCPKNQRINNPRQIKIKRENAHTHEHTATSSTTTTSNQQSLLIGISQHQFSPQMGGHRLTKQMCKHDSAIPLLHSSNTLTSMTDIASGKKVGKKKIPSK